MAADQLDYLRDRRKTHVGFQSGQLDCSERYLGRGARQARITLHNKIHLVERY